MSTTYGGYLEGYGGATTSPPTPGPNLPQPELIVEVDLANDPNPDTDIMPDPIWTDISEYVRVGGFSLKRGRARTLDRNEAGTCTVQLDNRDRRFDPSYIAGPYYPDLLPNRRIRVQALAETGTTAFHVGDSFVGSTNVLDGGIILLGLFYGYTDSWTQDYPAQGFDATVTVRSTDMFGLLSQERLTLDAGGIAEPAGSMMDLILNETVYTGRVAGAEGTTASSPARDLAPGREVRGEAWADAGALEVLQRVAASDGGNFFISREGRVTYLPAEAAEPDIIPIYGPAGEDVSGVSREYDDTLIYNHVTVTMPGPLSITATDATSIARYGTHPLEVATLLTDTTEGAQRAAEILQQYRSPVPAVRRLEMHNTTEDWQQVLQTDLWDTILLQVPLPDGGTFEQLSRVEGISIASTQASDWNITWELSVADPFPNLLTDEQSSFEAGTTVGWAAETNCTITTSTYQSYAGDYAMQIAAVAAGDAAVLSTPVAVTAGMEYSAAAYLRTPRSFDPYVDARVDIVWYDAGAAVLSTTTGDVTAIPSRRWRYLSASAVAPAGAVSASVRVAMIDVAGAPAGLFYDDLCYYLDLVSLRRTI